MTDIGPPADAYPKKQEQTKEEITEKIKAQQAAEKELPIEKKIKKHRSVKEEIAAAEARIAELTATLDKDPKGLREMIAPSDIRIKQFDATPRQDLLEEKNRLEKFLSGIKDMYKLPAALIVVDAKKERIAVAEANKLNIPVVAIIDTNTDPDPIDYPIAGTDDAIKSISVIIQSLADAIIAGQSSVEEKEMADLEEEKA